MVRFIKNRFLIPLLLLGVTIVSAGQDHSFRDKFNWLMGEWRGEGSGNPGQGSGTFEFTFALDSNIIIRKNHTEFPATDTKPEIKHDDLLIIYPGHAGNPDKAVYFDNEGHVIWYTLTYPDNSVVLTSDRLPDLPSFRLAYSRLDNETINTRFEMAREGDKYKTYLEGKSKRIKSVQ